MVGLPYLKFVLCLGAPFLIDHGLFLFWGATDPRGAGLCFCLPLSSHPLRPRTTSYREERPFTADTSRSSSIQKESKTEDRFRFTPVKCANSLPRLWDRKPSISFLSQQSRPRKVWKRFRTSFNSMKSLQQIIADRALEETELDTEINASRGAGLLRGVKRRCLDIEIGEKEERGRSFLETRWEGEVRRRRELLSIFTRLLFFCCDMQY